MKQEPKQKISILFPSDVLMALRQLAQDNDRSFNGEVIHALRAYIAQNDPALQRRSPEMPSDVRKNGADQS
jgi:hypothetical protein